LPKEGDTSAGLNSGVSTLIKLEKYSRKQQTRGMNSQTSSKLVKTKIQIFPLKQAIANIIFIPKSTI